MTPSNAALSGSRLVVIGASPNIAAIAREIDARTIFVQQPGSPVTELIGPESNLYSLDFTDDRRFSSFVREVLAPLRPAAAISVTEAGLRAAAIANELLGTTGTPVAVVERFNDKLLMRQCMAKKVPGLSGRFAAAQNGAEAAEIMRRWGTTRAVLKPRTGTASRGVRLVHDPSWFDPLDDLTSFFFEDYFPGPEYSAESFSRGGIHRLLAVTETHVFDSTFVESAHVEPARLSADEVHSIEESIAAFLDAMGLRDGPAHTELKLFDGGVKIIESHTRVAGGGIADLVRLTTGVDYKRLALGWPVGLTEHDCTSAPQSRAAAVAFASAPAGHVWDVLLPHVTGSEGVDVVSLKVRVTPGDTVGELSDSRQPVGLVMATGDEPAAVLAETRALAARIIVDTRP